MTTTDNKRRPLSLEITGYGKVRSEKLYTVDEAADIMRMMVEVVDKLAESPRDARLYSRGLEVTPSDGRQSKAPRRGCLWQV